MNILVIGKLSDQSLSSFIRPIESLSFVEKIVLVRDEAFSLECEKIQNENGLRIFKNSAFRHFVKFVNCLIRCRREKIDVIVAIHLYPHGYIGYIVSKLNNIPFVHTIIAGKREFYLYGKIIERLNLILMKSVYKFTVTGEDTRNYLIEKKIQKRQIDYLPNVINTKKFYPIDIKKEFDILSLSLIDDNKNISLIIHAISILKKKNVKLEAAIASNGCKKMDMIKLTNDLGLADEIKFPGWIPENEKSMILNKSRMFVLPSKGEGMPLAILEAMCCGIVPVCSGVGDIKDIVKDRENGIIINNLTDANELAEAIEELKFNKKFYNKLSKRAIETGTIYSYEYAGKMWEKVLRRNIGRK